MISTNRESGDEACGLERFLAAGSAVGSSSRFGDGGRRIARHGMQPMDDAAETKRHGLAGNDMDAAARFASVGDRLPLARRFRPKQLRRQSSRTYIRISARFSPAAAVVAAAVVSFPLVYQATKTGFLAVDRDLEDAARTDGAGEWRVFRYVTLPLSSRSLLAAAILGFCRSLGEFGATLMVAGNIPGKTQTVPTAIYIAVGSGDMKTAWAWTASIVFLSFLLLLLADRLPANRPFSR